MVSVIKVMKWTVIVFGRLSLFSHYCVFLVTQLVLSSRLRFWLSMTWLSSVKKERRRERIKVVPRGARSKENSPAGSASKWGWGKVSAETKPQNMLQDRMSCPEIIMYFINGINTCRTCVCMEGKTMKEIILYIRASWWSAQVHSDVWGNTRCRTKHTKMIYVTKYLCSLNYGSAVLQLLKLKTL